MRCVSGFDIPKRTNGSKSVAFLLFHYDFHPKSAPKRVKGIEMAKTAAVLIVGNELLSGKTRESNLIELARLLRSLGIQLERAVFVLDDVETIAREVSTLASSFDYLFTSGGVGPTHDDVTLEAIAQSFGVPVVTQPDLLALYKKHYGEKLNEGHIRLAGVPQGAKLLTTSASPWPLAVMKNVWILPGIPEVFRMKLPIIRQHLGADRPFLTRAVFTKMDEPDLKPLLDEVVRKHPGVDVGSYPVWSDPKYRTKITFDGREKDLIDDALATLLDLLPEGEPQWVD
jgi:molybdopterin-biosynthesis enzyme MoeA-like protein